MTAHSYLFDDVVKAQRAVEKPLRISRRSVPQVIKYMGSKASILDFVIGGLNRVYDGGGVCDLFAGSCILSGAIGDIVPVMSNDIQTYSKSLAGLYLTAWRGAKFDSAERLAAEAAWIAESNLTTLPTDLDHAEGHSLREFVKVEKRNRALIDLDFPYKWHLFAKVYSGTWWSARQCAWIDAIRQVAEKRRNTPHFDLIMASLMHAMAYCSQGTGHYAQYRDAKDESSMRDIAIYRRRNLIDYFVKKYRSLSEILPTQSPTLAHEITSMDFRERLRTLPRCTVYADPPYCFVHYSRFYHAIETLYQYDFPSIQVKSGKVVKGRYRENRHQSPFSIRSEVPGAFKELFEGVAATESNLALSYSNTGMITLEELEPLGRRTLGTRYRISTILSDHKHMTMGRKADRDRDVSECLLLGTV